MDNNNGIVVSGDNLFINYTDPTTDTDKKVVLKIEKLLEAVHEKISKVTGQFKGCHLVTTDEFFIGPDGRDYKAVWGEVEILEDSILGIKTNARSSNWFLKVGHEQNYVIIAGCQVHYITKCPQPYSGEIKGWPELNKKGEYVIPTLPSRVYVIPPKIGTIPVSISREGVMQLKASENVPSHQEPKIVKQGKGMCKGK